MLSFRGSLYIVDINQLSNILFANIFFNKFVFSLYWLCPLVHRNFSFWWNLVNFFLCCLCCWCHIQEIITKPNVMKNFLCILLRVLYSQLLCFGVWSVLINFCIVVTCTFDIKNVYEYPWHLIQDRVTHSHHCWLDTRMLSVINRNFDFYLGDFHCEITFCIWMHLLNTK